VLVANALKLRLVGAHEVYFTPEGNETLFRGRYSTTGEVAGLNVIKKEFMACWEDKDTPIAQDLVEISLGIGHV